ncbi:hypothetical protein [Aureimonas endophytica]|nr:hypothetical protein [Aureimonas endophytica]
MHSNSHLRDLAERHFRPQPDTTGEGLAALLVSAEAKANDEKTARLKALRMERDGVVRPERAKPMRPSAATRLIRR